MKSIAVLFLLMFCCAISRGQDIRLNAKSVSPSGINLESEDVNLSKWRLGKVYTIVLSKDISPSENGSEWDVKPYPNPFSKSLNLEFNTKTLMEVEIQIIDAEGRKVYDAENRKVLPGQTINLDLTNLAPSLYLLSIISKDQSTRKICKIQKQ